MSTLRKCFQIIAFAVYQNGLISTFLHTLMVLMCFPSYLNLHFQAALQCIYCRKNAVQLAVVFQGNIKCIIKSQILRVKGKGNLDSRLSLRLKSHVLDEIIFE